MCTTRRSSHDPRDWLIDVEAFVEEEIPDELFHWVMIQYSLGYSPEYVADLLNSGKPPDGGGVNDEQTKEKKDGAPLEWTQAGQETDA